MMRLYDTRTQSYQLYEPTAPIKIYVCGITPYASAHLGHAFTFITYDLLQRRLEDAGHSVTMVRNVTDVDDPLFAKADEMEIDYRELAAAEVETFNETMHNFNLMPGTLTPLASQYIDHMAAAVKQLLDQGDAYRLDDDVYFDTAQSEGYGSLLGLRPELAENFSRLRGGDPDRPGKRNRQDFLLWKGLPDTNAVARWESIVGPGRPGWHIECSVMSQSLLGDSFDIHGGGSDLIYPHHESEIAQSTALHGVSPAKLWMHVAPILLAGEKMSKSLGNLVFVAELMEQYQPSVVRLALMHYHHRIGGEWTAHMLDEANLLWQNLNHASCYATEAETDQMLVSVRRALDDDLNTLEVIDALHTYIGSVNYDAKRTEPDIGFNSLKTLLGL